MKSHKINDLDNFIAGWYMDDDTLMNDIMQFHDTNPAKAEGVFISEKYGPVVDESIKKSFDTTLEDSIDLTQRYHSKLQQILEFYIDKYPSCNYYSSFSVREHTNVQSYPIGDGAYHAYHCERPNSHEVMTVRHLVFMTYLNDVAEGGETEFLNQKLKIKPEKGLTVIWPSDWTYTHRGLPSNSDIKYIVTGWWSYDPL
jgi:hypothetical protein